MGSGLAGEVSGTAELDSRSSWVFAWVVDRISVTLAAMTSRVSIGTIFAAFARCIVLAIVTAILSPVKLPGPAEI